MHDRGKSDRLVVPAKLLNNPAQAGAEVVEGRGLPEGNTAGETRPGLGAGLGVSSELDRVRRVARKDRDVELRFKDAPHVAERVVYLHDYDLGWQRGSCVAAICGSTCRGRHWRRAERAG